MPDELTGASETVAGGGRPEPEQPSREEIAAPGKVALRTGTVPTSEPGSEPGTRPVREPDGDPDEEPDIEPDIEPEIEPVREPDGEPDDDPGIEPIREPDAEPAEMADTGASIRLDRKHPLAIRWMHWINFPVLFTMIWSGLLIYWGDSDNSYLHPHRVYRVGVGSLTLFRFFPEWFYRWLNAPYRITTGLGYHFFFMWIFAINGVIYVLYTILSGEWRLIVPERKSLREAIQVTLVDLHLRKGLPPQKKYNGAQRIAYTATILMGLGSLVTGLAIYKPTQAHLVTTLLGGYEMARWLHFWLTIGFSGFFVVHVVQVVMAGWNNFRSMVSGYEIVPAEKASLDAERRS